MAVMITNTELKTAKKSWADIVKGADSPSAPETDVPSTAASDSEPPSEAEVQAESGMKPAKRGERRCFCQGEILVMLGHYGWIMAFDEIDHPDIDKTAGRIYVHKRDLPKGVSLARGDVVSFYLYVDEQGLGAEGCRLEQSAWPKDHGYASYESPALAPDADAIAAPSWNACASGFVPASFSSDAKEFFPGALNSDANEFVPGPLNSEASEFVPGALISEATDFIPGCFNTEAKEFVPGVVSTMNGSAQEFMPSVEKQNVVAPAPTMFSFNPAFFSDDDSDNESSIASDDDYAGRDGDKESISSDKESSYNESEQSFQQDDEVAWSAHLDAVVLCVDLKSPRAASVAESTSAGGASDSDTDAYLMTPPGLNLPAGWRPPPGLSFPALVA